MESVKIAFQPPVLFTLHCIHTAGKIAGGNAEYGRKSGPKFPYPLPY